MRTAPTLEGGLQLVLEDAVDLLLLRCIQADAGYGSTSLAGRLGRWMGEEGAEDWREYVMPDLDGHFAGQLDVVSQALQGLTEDSLPATVFIRPQEGESWYGALNQARLALEECYSFGSGSLPATAGMEKSAACFRSGFYARLQGEIFRSIMS